MLGSYPIGSQAVGSGGAYATAVNITIVAAVGRSSGSASVFATSAAIISAAGKAVGKSVVRGASGIAPGSLRAGSSLVFSLVPMPYSVSYSPDIRYTLALVQP